MKRVVNQQFTEVIERGFSYIPVGIRSKLIHVDFLTGIDPLFAGLHRYGDTPDSRSYGETAHVAYPFHQSLPSYLRRTTVVLPMMVRPSDIVHELGHVLDEVLKFTIQAEPISIYAKTNRREAFAEAFTAWLIRGYAKICQPTISGIDEKTASLLKTLDEVWQ